MLSNGETGAPRAKSKAAKRGFFTVNPTSINVPTDADGQPVTYQFQEYPKYIAEADTGDPDGDHLAQDAAHEARIRARLEPKADEASEDDEPKKKPGRKPKAE